MYKFLALSPLLSEAGQCFQICCPSGFLYSLTELHRHILTSLWITQYGFNFIADWPATPLFLDFHHPTKHTHSLFIYSIGYRVEKKCANVCTIHHLAALSSKCNISLTRSLSTRCSCGQTLEKTLSEKYAFAKLAFLMMIIFYLTSFSQRHAKRSSAQLTQQPWSKKHE